MPHWRLWTFGGSSPAYSTDIELWEKRRAFRLNYSPVTRATSITVLAAAGMAGAGLLISAAGMASTEA